MQMEADRISRSFARTVADDVQFNCQRLVNSDRVNGNELLAVARTFLGLMSQSPTGELIVKLRVCGRTWMLTVKLVGRPSTKFAHLSLSWTVAPLHEVKKRTPTAAVVAAFNCTEDEMVLYCFFHSFSCVLCYCSLFIFV